MADKPDIPEVDAPRPLLRYCPLEPGELIDREACSLCPHRPEPPFTICAVSGRRSRPPRRRGFWDSEL